MFQLILNLKFELRNLNIWCDRCFEKHTNKWLESQPKTLAPIGQRLLPNFHPTRWINQNPDGRKKIVTDLRTYLDHKSDDKYHGHAGYDICMILNEKFVAENRRVFIRTFASLDSHHRSVLLRLTLIIDRSCLLHLTCHTSTTDYTHATRRAEKNGLFSRTDFLTLSVTRHTGQCGTCLALRESLSSLIVDFQCVSYSHVLIIKL